MAPMRMLLLAFLVSAACASEKAAFFEPFDTNFEGKWIVSSSADYGGKWKWAKGEVTDDYGLLVSEKAKKYGIAAVLPEPLDPKEDALVLQYDVRLQNGLDCGGAYLKFLMPQEAGWSPSQFKDDSPYSVMFGPDKCGSTNKVHFIFRHKSPKTGEYVEHHLKSTPYPMSYDKQSHVYTAIVHPNNTLHILIDGELKTTADLLSDKDFSPSVVPSKTIPDKDDKKPDDWDERPKIHDPDATKPDDRDEDAPREIVDEEASKPKGWLDDEPEEIDDPEAVKPDDWDEEEDGEWEPPKVPNPRCEEAPGCGEWKRPMKRNPAFKGKWTPPLIDNPAFKGIWKPREIPNPEYFELDRPNLEPVAAVGIEIWTMSDGILFDNILVTSDPALAERIRKQLWQPKHLKEKADEQAKRDAEDAKLKKETKATKSGWQKTIFDALYKIADTLPFLNKQLKQLISAGEEYPIVTYVVLALVPLLPFLLLIPVLLASPKPRTARASPVSVEKAKKEDITSPDDTAVAKTPTETEGGEDVKKDGEAAAEPAAGPSTKPSAEPSTEAAAEVAEAAGEDGDDDGGEAKVRRRPRRA